MNILAMARVDGIPGPKGSLNGFCVTCAKARRPQKIVMKEQSEVGARFRVIVRNAMRIGFLTGSPAYEGPAETHLTFFIHRQKVVKAGVEQDAWVPSHQAPYPIHRNSGDVEKHVRTVHDALMDAGVILDDSQVWRTVSAKVWADAEHRPGVYVEVIKS